MEQKLVMKEGLEECLYCHGNSRGEQATSCPVCGDVSLPKTEVRKPEARPVQKLEARSQVLYEPLVAGV